jgi:hypothetical protein
MYLQNQEYKNSEQTIFDGLSVGYDTARKVLETALNQFVHN